MTLQEFISSITRLSCGADVACREVCEEWKPEAPPAITLLSAIGLQIADDIYNQDQEVKSQIFELIERAMESDDQVLATAVATGLIEALVARTEQNPDLWGELSLMLGTRSFRHAKAWRGE